MKNFIVLSLLVVLQVLGNIGLSRGMRQVGEVDSLNLFTLLGLGLRMITNPWFMLGLLLLIAFFLVYLAALSWLDLSYVLPMLASSYVVTAGVAWLVLGETVSLTRWLGTFSVSAGVLLVSLSERHQEQQTQPRAMHESGRK